MAAADASDDEGSSSKGKTGFPALASFAPEDIGANDENEDFGGLMVRIDSD